FGRVIERRGWRKLGQGLLVKLEGFAVGELGLVGSLHPCQEKTQPFPGIGMEVSVRGDLRGGAALRGKFAEDLDGAPKRLLAFGASEADAQQAVVMRYPPFRSRIGGQLQGPPPFAPTPTPRILSLGVAAVAQEQFCIVIRGPGYPFVVRDFPG